MEQQTEKPDVKVPEQDDDATKPNDPQEMPMDSDVQHPDDDSTTSKVAEVNTEGRPNSKPESGENIETEACSKTDTQLGATAVGTPQDSGIDLYAYTKDGQFTSEIFKIEVFNLPNYVGFGQLKKRIQSLDLKPVKVKMVGQKGCAFVTFRSDEDRDEALKKCNGHVWKGKTWSAKKALPAADPLFRKRKFQAEGNNEPKEKVAKEEADIPPAERLNLAVTPWYKQPYLEQLESKEGDMRAYIKKLTREIKQNNDGAKYQIINEMKQNDGLCCPMDPIKPSPAQNGYRNKCEFTIGRSPDGREKTVGFRFGRYSKGVTSVLEVDDCIHVPDAMKKVTKAIQTYIQEHSTYPSYVPEDKTGNWRQATVRTNCRGDIMLLLVFHPHKLTEDEVTAEREKVKAYFEKGDGSKCGITSMYFSVRTDRISDPTKEEHLFGHQHIEEDLLDLKFRISPTAFFQVNTKAAEVLYSTVADWCCVSDKTILLDVCCGTGTIGLSMAKRVHSVVGVELCAEAVEDAKFNAKLNGITNSEFVCSKAEQYMPGFVRNLYGKQAVAVVDPPRGGLHPDVVRAIRKCTAIKRVVYVSCNPNGALQNIVDFTRSESRRIKGSAFRLVRAVAVDMFPHSPHCELVMLLDRDDSKKEPQEKPNVSVSETVGETDKGSTNKSADVADLKRETIGGVEAFKSEPIEEPNVPQTGRKETCDSSEKLSPAQTLDKPMDSIKKESTEPSESALTSVQEMEVEADSTSPAEPSSSDQLTKETI